ncbi:uncharacterized protein [Eleutherodactylus coqui]|uniref:uncharacterized protein n=1 Tax=Eleutherodactylus coqui TaxID=57060 RepID=UPI00346360D4
MRSSGSTQNKLQEIRTSKRIRGYYERGKFLTIAEVQSRLASYEEFPVLALQHVTTHKDAEKILRSKFFKGRKHERPEFNDLSFWSVDVSSDVIEKARHQAYEAMRTVVKAEELETFHEEIKEQFANSAAFDRSASRYGNFKFSFPLSLLLSRYKTQHCKGGEPELRILGTDIYKQEIAHYIVVHSPHTEVFKDLQKVPAMTTGSHDNSVVCWMDETLYWRPESTSSSLLLRVSNNSCTERNDDLQPKSGPIMRPRVPRCVWNHLVVTFHLPNAGKLEIPNRFLLRNLMPCHALQPYLNEDPIQKHQARERIRAFNKNIRTSLDCR